MCLRLGSRPYNRCVILPLLLLLVSPLRRGCRRSFSLLSVCLFISLAHRRIGMFSVGVGGEKCEWICEGGALGVVGGCQISAGQ